MQPPFSRTAASASGIIATTSSDFAPNNSTTRNRAPSVSGKTHDPPENLPPRERQISLFFALNGPSINIFPSAAFIVVCILFYGEPFNACPDCLRRDRAFVGRLIPADVGLSGSFFGRPRDESGRVFFHLARQRDPAQRPAKPRPERIAASVVVQLPPLIPSRCCQFFIHFVRQIVESVYCGLHFIYGEHFNACPDCLRRDRAFENRV